MPTKTEYYDFEKPDIDASENTWGELLNADLDKVDSAIRNCLHLTSHSAFETPLTANVCELPIYAPVQADATKVEHSQLLATQGWVEGRIRAIMNQFLPVNSIMMWWGTWGSVPAGWSFCDGTAGSPDLRDRFVLCAGAYLAPQSKAGTPSYYPGEHTHAISYNTYPGPAGPTLLAVNNNQAVYPGGANTIPYFAVLYIRKHANW